MNDPITKLEADLARVRGAKPARKVSQAGYAFRVGTELVSGVAVGAAIGYGLDAWLETRPWMTLLWSIFGFAAGMRLMLQTAKKAGEEMQAEETKLTGEP